MSDDIELTYDQIMQQVAAGLDDILKEIFGPKSGWCLLTFELGEDGKAASYISNAERETMIKFLKETVARLEANEDIQGVTGGGIN